jgi:uncharacterized membrane protein
MNKNRLEAFSDGVIAIIITIMVLELKVPHEAEFSALRPLVPVFFSYLVSFTYVGIYWNNHHHMLHATHRVSGPVLWANLHLLFWLSLFPFVTAWAGENHFSSATMALYGGVLLMAALAYWLLQYAIIHTDCAHTTLKTAVGNDWKGKASPVLYATGIALSFYFPWASALLYILVALMWLVPDQRIEKILASE